MTRFAVLLAAVALAGCGGGPEPEPAPAPQPRPNGGDRVVSGEVRTPDARTPLVRGDGLWSCETTGSVELRVSVEGLATLFMHGRLLASVAPQRALVNRSCDAEPLQRLPSFRSRRAVTGDSHMRCAVPQRVLVDLRDGDLTVREPRGRFLLGAAVSDRHLEAAGHWAADCALSR